MIKIKPFTTHILLGLLKTDIVKVTTEDQRNKLEEKYNIDLSSCLDLTVKEMEQESDNIVEFLLEHKILTVNGTIPT